MRTLLGLLSILSFVAVLLIALLLIASKPDNMIVPILALAVALGLTVFFRALRSRV